MLVDLSIMLISLFETSIAKIETPYSQFWTCTGF
jgi:hypothetical protein